MENPKSDLHISSLNPIGKKPKPSESPNRNRILDKLRDAVVQIANSDPNKHLSSHQISLIEQRLHQIFPVIRTPTHPTYSFMLHNAITELNEEEGSSEESISEYIKANFDGLPWAHERYLSHHLGRLCASGEIVVTSSKRYSIPGLIPKRRRVKGKRGRKRKEVMGIGEENFGGCGTSDVNVTETSCSIEQEDGRRSVVRRKRLSLALSVDDEEDEVKEAEMHQVEVGSGIKGCEENLGGCGTSDVNVIETSASIEQDDGRRSAVRRKKLSLGIYVDEEKDEVKEAEMHQVEVGSGIKGCEVRDLEVELDVGRQEGEIVVARNLEECLDDMVEVPFSTVGCQTQIIQESTSWVDWQSMESIGQIVPLNAVNELVEEQLPREDVLLRDVPPSEVRSEMLQWDADHHCVGDSLAVVPYEAAIPKAIVKKKIKKINPIVDCVVACGLAAKMPEQSKHSGKKYHQKKKQKCSAISSSMVSYDSAIKRRYTYSSSPKNSSVVQEQEAECSGGRNSWHFVLDRFSNVFKFFHRSKGKADEADQGKVPEDSNIVKSAQVGQPNLGLGNVQPLRLCQLEQHSHRILSEQEESMAHCNLNHEQGHGPSLQNHHEPPQGAVPSQELSNLKQDVQVKVSFPGPEPAVAAPAEKSLPSDDQHTEQQVKQTKKRGRKKKERPKSPASAIYPFACSVLFSQNQHELQPQTLGKGINPFLVSKIAVPLELDSASGDVDNQQEKKKQQEKSGREKLESHRDQVQKSPISDPEAESISLQDHLHKHGEPVRDPASPCGSKLPTTASMEQKPNLDSQVDIQEEKRHKRCQQEDPIELELSVEVNAMESLSSMVQHEQLEERQHGGPVTGGSDDAGPTAIADLPSRNQVSQHLEDKRKRGRGRPRKLHNELSVVLEKKREQEDPVELQLSVEVNAMESLSSMVQHEPLEEQQQGGPVPDDAGRSAIAELPSRNQVSSQHLELKPKRGRGRPRKLLHNQLSEVLEKEPEHEGSGCPPKQKAQAEPIASQDQDHHHLVNQPQQNQVDGGEDPEPEPEPSPFSRIEEILPSEKELKQGEQDGVSMPKAEQLQQGQGRPSKKKPTKREREKVSLVAKRQMMQRLRPRLEQ